MPKKLRKSLKCLLYTFPLIFGFALLSVLAVVKRVALTQQFIVFGVQALACFFAGNPRLLPLSFIDDGPFRPPLPTSLLYFQRNVGIGGPPRAPGASFPT